MIATCPDDFNTILIFPHHFLFSGRFQNRSDFSRSFPIIQTVSQLSGWLNHLENSTEFWNCLENRKWSGKTWTLLKPSGKWKMIWRNLDSFKIIWTIGNHPEKLSAAWCLLYNPVMFHAVKTSKCYRVSKKQFLWYFLQLENLVSHNFVQQPSLLCAKHVSGMILNEFQTKLCETRFSYGTPFHQILIKPSHQWRAYPHYRLFSEKRTIFCKWWSAYFCLHSKSCKKYLSKSPELYVNYIWMNIWIKCQLWLWHFYDTFSWDLVSSISFKAPHFLLLNIARIANAVQVTIWL